MKNPRSSQRDATQAIRPSPRASAPPDPLLGTQLGEFVIKERIGAGGMGVVYRAEHPLIGKQAAIKVMRMELVSPQQVQRLLVEARSVNAIRHTGIIDIFGFGTLPDERPYVIMELLRGRSLSDFVRENRRMELESVIWVMDQMLAALGAAHRAGVVHRDLKPANVFVVEAPETPISIRLVDFGIAKLMESRDNPLTADGLVLGTPEFMAPEQIRGDTVGPATDLYAAGVMMFQLLTGVRPFQGESVQVMFAHLEQSPPTPSSRLEGLPKEVDALVLRLLAKDPASRPPSAEAVREQLKRIPLRSPARAPSLASPEVTLPAVESLTPDTREALEAIRKPPGIGWALIGALVLLSVGAGVIRLRSVPSIEAAADAGVDARTYAGFDARFDAGTDAEDDAGTDAGVDAGTDAGVDARTDGGPPPPPPANHLLLKRIEALSMKLRRRSEGGPEPTALKASLLQIKQSASYARTAKDCAAIRPSLDSWEKRFNEQFPPR
ncbi:serine/threonine protein kinase [Corallococcus coralloides DSM 2259]|uniref:non-specific serine/threonine protein kinase n=1 Tax=Corallococcus coralloides (strain ATCC 25202 / DSM 2259 / NBRC 100086 / M2) TaxID=1144275 RepID=H8MGW9_CORCM|nr:serine/threonine-protein kinase [Corallococcus coralloides]AFE09871.1 serine/threonine protein kinase [Corallococcus coralloides DSM 2259]